MERTKYIAAIVLGFLVILALGVVSIKLFRAKRSTAPEYDAAVIATPTPTTAPATALATSDAALDVPVVVSSGPADAATLPDAVVKYLGQERTGVVVQSVVYEGGKNGVKFERELPLAISALNESMRAGILADKSLLRYAIGPEQSLFAFKSVNPSGRVVVSLQKKSDTTTFFSGHLIFE